MTCNKGSTNAHSRHGSVSYLVSESIKKAQDKIVDAPPSTLLKKRVVKTKRDENLPSDPDLFPRNTTPTPF